MNSETKTLENAEATPNQDRETWVKPEILSLDPIGTTQANTRNPGDNFSSNS